MSACLDNFMCSGRSAPAQVWQLGIPPVQLWVVPPYTTHYLSQPFPVLVVTVHTIPCGQLSCLPACSCWGEDSIPVCALRREMFSNLVIFYSVMSACLDNFLCNGRSAPAQVWQPGIPPVQLWVVPPYTTHYLGQPFRSVLVVTVHTIPCGQLSCLPACSCWGAAVFQCVH